MRRTDLVPLPSPSEAPAVAHASIVNGSSSDVARAVTPTEDVSALLVDVEPPPVVSKQRKRNQLSADKKVDSACFNFIKSPSRSLL